MKAISILIALSLLPAQAQLPNHIRDYWFSGGAEISTFKLSQSRYGEEHPGHAEFIFVTEPFLTKKQVKNESGSSPSTPVLKLNALRTFNTGLYSYRTMRSTFLPVDQKTFPYALKSTASIQDWCGLSFQQLNRRRNGWSLQLNSYFEAEADLSEKLSNAYLEDALWIRLRLNPTTLPTGTIKLIPGAIFNRFSHRKVQVESATAELKTQNKQLIYTIHYPDFGRKLSITADTAFPHIIREWSEKLDSSSATTHAKLTHQLVNTQYWSQHDLKHAPLRKKLGLEATPN